MYAELTELLEKLKTMDDEYDKYNILNEIDSIISAARFDISHDTESGNSYYSMIAGIMMRDIASYLENYKNANELPGYEYYEIKAWKANHGSIRLMCNVPFRGQINTKGLIQEVNGFQKYNVLKLLGLNNDLSIVSKSDATKFIDMRNNNPLYFLELETVQNLIQMLHEVVVL